MTKELQLIPTNQTSIFWDFKTCFCKNTQWPFLSVSWPATTHQISTKLDWAILSNNRKSSFWELFDKIWANKTFPKNLPRSVFSLYSLLTSCTISEKTNDWILRKSKKSPFVGPFCPNLGKREFSQKIGLRHFWAFMLP